MGIGRFVRGVEGLIEVQPGVAASLATSPNRSPDRLA